MTCLTSAISFSLEKDEVVSLDCGLFYPISGLHPLNKATMKVHCDIAAGIQVVEYSLRKDDDKSRLLTIESISVCEVRSMFPNKHVAQWILDKGCCCGRRRQMVPDRHNL
jgi:hypothetical protein